MNREKPIQNALIRWLNLVPGCMAVTYYNGAVFDPRAKRFYKAGLDRPNGFPDIVGSFRGQAFCIEVKSETGRLSPAQKLVHEKLKMKGWPVAVCRSIQDAEAFLRSLIGGHEL